MTLQQPGIDDGEPREAGDGPEFEVIAGRPTPAELAAVTAVLTSMIEELEDGQRAEGLAVSAWQRSQRSIRRPLVRGAGAWRSFSG
ncbi:acyl-CoA carboxylase subunit epsilon [Lacisediminihabitans sp. H27-G8]|uniref:acyl-CoA carboxylase subunit epsilon n=1 Tax=Lacisediminihabitans sp. H27-G8 TaxID=3111909 RepID=UPI0038FC636B